MPRSSKRSIFEQQFQQAKLEVFAALDYFIEHMKDYDQVGPRLGRAFLEQDLDQLRKIKSATTMRRALINMQNKINALPPNAADKSGRGDHYLFEFLIDEYPLKPTFDSLSDEQKYLIEGADTGGIKEWDKLRDELNIPLRKVIPINTPAVRVIYPFYRTLLNSVAHAVCTALKNEEGELQNQERQQKAKTAVDQQVAFLKQSWGEVLVGLG